LPNTSDWLYFKNCEITGNMNAYKKIRRIYLKQAEEKDIGSVLKDEE